VNSNTAQRYENAAIWSELLGEARGKLEHELAALLAWRRVAELRAEAKSDVKERQKEYDKLMKALPELERKQDETRKAHARATERYNATLSRDPEGARGSDVDTAQRDAGKAAGDARSAYMTAWRRMQVLERELATFQRVRDRLERIVTPETPLLEALKLV